jgi:drug/metabolite transporter (DMT)-like permease
MDWFPLALLCALALASADAFTKRYFPDYRSTELLLVRFAVPALLLVPMTVLYPLPPVPLAFWGWMVALVPLELLAMLLYVIAIRDSPLHVTLPYLAFTPVFNVLTGYLILGEQVSGLGLLGILLVVAGAYLLNLERIGQGWLAPLRAIGRERGSRLMLGVATIYSLTSVMGKAALQLATPASFGAFYYVVLGACMLVLILVRSPGDLRVLTRRPLPLLAVGGLMAVMVVTHFLAIAEAEVAYFVAVKRASLLFGILYGALWFGERHLRRNLLAGTLMVAGVGLILS